MTSRYAIAVLATAATLAFAGSLAAPAFAQGDFDTPTITLGQTGLAKQTVTVTAGPSGAPAGFTIWWMKRTDFDANRGQWWLYGDSRQGEAHFQGTPTLNHFPGDASSFALGPNQTITVEIGDLFDETGVSVSPWRAGWGGELEYGTQYVFCAFANGTVTTYQSGFTDNFDSQTIQTQNCTFTIGYWKNHPEAWPANCFPMTLGANQYSAADIMAILNTQPQGNGALSMAHQLIGAKLNACLGANTAAAAACMASADAMLSGCGADKLPPFGTCSLSSGTTSANTQCMDDFNQGITGPGHCQETPVKHSTWGQLKVLHR